MTSLPIRLRLGALVLIAIALAAPFTASAGTFITCADFNNPDAAQHLLDVDDSYADADAHSNSNPYPLANSFTRATTSLDRY